MASGAWESITINGRRFTCKADDDVTYHLSGGFENEILPQGDGTMQMKKTRVSGAISGININIDDSRDDLEFIEQCQNSTSFFPVTGTKVDGTVLSGSMQITDKNDVSSAENTLELSLEGTLEKL